MRTTTAWDQARPVRSPALALLVEDGMPGGVRRAVDYLVDEWGDRDDAPASQRLALRGEAGLLASGPVFIRALRTFFRLSQAGRVRLLHLNITQRGSTARAMALALAARITGIPVVLHLHSSEYPAFVRSLPRPALLAVRSMFRNADRVVVLGDSWADFVARNLGVDRRRVTVLRNAVPGPVTVPAHDPESPPRVLFLGRLGHRKGVADLLDALARLEPAALPWEAVLAGDGDRAPFEEQVRRLGIVDRVHFTGWIDEAAVRRQLEAASILVLPSYAEGLPLSVLEGLAHGLAVVATPVGAIPEVIENGRNGLLVPPGNVPQLAVALQQLLCEPERRAEIAARGRETWERDHSAGVYARRVAALYEELAPELTRTGTD